MKDVQVFGFESDGVTLISPLAAEFDTRTDALAAPGMADVVKAAKPYVVIVSNNSTRTIVALTTSSSNADGTETPSALSFTYPPAPAQNQLFMAPDAVGGAGLDFGDRSITGILPGGQRLIGLGFGIPEVRPKFEPPPEEPEWDDERMWNWTISTTRDFVERIKKQGERSTGIRVRLDAVIFDDGLLIGPDTNGFLCRHFEGNVKARQELYQEIVTRLDGGMSVEEAFQVPTSEPPGVMELANNFGYMFRQEAIGTANRLRKRYGDATIRETLQQAILKQPFVIHQK